MRSVELRFRSHIVRPTLEHLAERGADIAALIRATGLPNDAAGAAYVDVPLSSVHEFFAHAEKIDPAIGVHVGQRLSRSTWDVIQLSALSAPTVGAAFHKIGTLIPLFNDFVRIEVRESAEGTSLEHMIDGQPLGLSRHGNELWLVATLERARQATGADVRPLACWLAHPRPDDDRALSEVLRTARIEYGAGATGVLLSPADAARPLLSADPVLLAALDRLAARSLDLVGNRGAAALVSRHLEEHTLDEIPPIAKVARALATSARSLQRELAEQGTSYRELVDQIRQKRARALLFAGTPVDDVAMKLGYSERSAFTRAFARWTGGRRAE